MPTLSKEERPRMDYAIIRALLELTNDELRSHIKGNDFWRTAIMKKWADTQKNGRNPEIGSLPVYQDSEDPIAAPDLPGEIDSEKGIMQLRKCLEWYLENSEILPSRTSAHELAVRIFEALPLPEEEGSKESSSPEDEMSVIPVSPWILSSACPGMKFHETPYHVTVSMGPGETSFSQISFRGYKRVILKDKTGKEAIFSGFLVSVNGKDNREDGREFHITTGYQGKLAGKPAKAFQTGFVLPLEKGQSYEGSEVIEVTSIPVSMEPFTALTVNVTKGVKMDDGLSPEAHCVFYTDMDGTLVTPPVFTDRKNIHASLQSLSEGTKLTHVGEALINSCGSELHVRTSRVVDTESDQKKMSQDLQQLVDDYLEGKGGTRGSVTVDLTFQPGRVSGKDRDRELALNKLERCSHLSTKYWRGKQQITSTPVLYFFDDKEVVTEVISDEGGPKVRTVHVTSGGSSIREVPKTPDRKAVVIGICGPCGSGKTTVFAELLSLLEGTVEIVSPDEWNAFGHPERSHYPSPYHYAESVAKSGRVDYLILDTTMSSGIPSWVDFPFYTEPGENFDSVWKIQTVVSVLQRTNHPSISFPFLPGVDYKISPEEEDNRSILDIVNAYGKTLDGKKTLPSLIDFFQGYDQGVKVFGEEENVFVVEYKHEAAKKFHATWLIQCRAPAFVWVKDHWECFKYPFDLGVETNTPESNRKLVKRLYQQVLAVFSGKSFTGEALLEAKVDGQCGFFTFVKGPAREVLERVWMEETVNSDPLVKKWRELLFSFCKDKEHLIIPCTRGTPFLRGEDMILSFIGAMYGNLKGSPVPLDTNPYKLVDEILPEFLDTRVCALAKKFFAEGDVSSFGILVEITNGPVRFDGAKFDELACPVEPDVYCIGVNLSGKFIPAGKFLEESTKCGFNSPYVTPVETGEDVKEILGTLSDMMRSSSSKGNFEEEISKKLGIEPGKTIHFEGFVLHVWDPESETWVYCKIKTQEYYAAHQKGMSSLPILAEYPDWLAEIFPKVAQAKSFLKDPRYLLELQKLLEDSLKRAIQELTSPEPGELQDYLVARFSADKPKGKKGKKIDPEQAVKGTLRSYQTKASNPKFWKVNGEIDNMIFDFLLLTALGPVFRKISEKKSKAVEVQFKDDFRFLITSLLTLEDLGDKITEFISEVKDSPKSVGDKKFSNILKMIRIYGDYSDPHPEAGSK